MSEAQQDVSPKKKKNVDVSLVAAGDESTDQDLRSGAQAGSAKKLRLVLAEDEQSQLFLFQQTLKERGVKNFELGDIVAEALATIPKEWWDAKIDEITPLEWKLHAALENPDMREKLMSLLNGKK
ncbi:MAG: hypothetical protein EOP10_17800 [Proteobacteria bacterium]|nr:MAG: hypothetical protein EOP10_17800 [Pseudomonadota bacterium]